MKRWFFCFVLLSTLTAGAQVTRIMIPAGTRQTRRSRPSPRKKTQPSA